MIVNQRIEERVETKLKKTKPKNSHSISQRKLFFIELMIFKMDNTSIYSLSFGEEEASKVKNVLIKLFLLNNV